MNFKNNLKIMGSVFKMEAALMLLPMIVALIYQEPFRNVIAFAIPAICLFVAGLFARRIQPDNREIAPRDAFFIVTVAWFLMSLVGALPFVINGDIPNYIDAFFETSSGFSTTGASILNNIEALQHSSLFWRSFTHWIGGMGILVFILAIMPKDDNGDGSTMYVLRAESPGPQVGKLVSKMRASTRILYIIYMSMTVILAILLALDPGLNVFDSLCLAFATAGTGGFANFNAGLANVSNYVQYVLSIGMLLFGVNFTLYYLLLIKKWRQVIKSEELHVYGGIIVVAVAFIAIMLFTHVGNIYTTGESAFRTALFQVASILTTTGFATTDFATLWPPICQVVLVALMFIGAMAGSTGGGIKVSRFGILFKSIAARLKRQVSPRRVVTVKFEDQVVSDEMGSQVAVFFVVYLLVLFLFAFLISFDGFDLLTNFTASLACISNIGPGLGAVGPMANYAGFSYFSKILLSIEMIVGRLEIFPVLVLFYARVWRKY
ncbi:MAG: TrkH family potassium uptake protein [Bacilli bacterium]